MAEEQGQSQDSTPTVAEIVGPLFRGRDDNALRRAAAFLLRANLERVKAHGGASGRGSDSSEFHSATNNAERLLGRIIDIDANAYHRRETDGPEAFGLEPVGTDEPGAGDIEAIADDELDQMLVDICAEMDHRAMASPDLESARRSFIRRFPRAYRIRIDSGEAPLPEDHSSVPDADCQA